MRLADGARQVKARLTFFPALRNPRVIPAEPRRRRRRPQERSKPAPTFASSGGTSLGACGSSRTTRARPAVASLELGALCLDYDHGVSLDEAVEQWGEPPGPSCSCMTYSHSPEAPRFRMVSAVRDRQNVAGLPLYCRISGEDHRAQRSTRRRSARRPFFYLPSVKPVWRVRGARARGRHLRRRRDPFTLPGRQLWRSSPQLPNGRTRPWR